MKSLIQEGSSIIKAIEKAWQNADKPTEFKIKIYEEPKYNFLGMTTKAAKVGIFFDYIPESKDSKRSTFTSDESRRSKKQPQQRSIEKTTSPKEPTAEKQVIWSAEMIKFVEQWLSTSLSAMQKDIMFETSAKNYHLYCSLKQPIISNPEKERAVYRALSLLILQALKKKFHRPLRGFKIVVLSEK